MEPSKSRTGINILIVLAMIFTGMSIMSAMNKKPSEIVTNPPAPVAPVDVVPKVEIPILSTTTDSTTTENTSTSTSTATTTINIKGFTSKNWTWMRTSNNGVITLPKKTTAFTITFNSDSSLKGTTDCNNFFGNYTVKTNELLIDKLGATQMFCEGSQEGDYIESLLGVVSYMIDKNNNLILNTGSSTMMFR